MLNCILSHHTFEQKIKNERNATFFVLNSSRNVEQFDGQTQKQSIRGREEVVVLLENENQYGGAGGGQDSAPSKTCSVLLRVDAAEPASRSRLWLGRSPACTHPSPTRQIKRDEGKNCWGFIYRCD